MPHACDLIAETTSAFSCRPAAISSRDGLLIMRIVSLARLHFPNSSFPNIVIDVVAANLQVHVIVINLAHSVAILIPFGQCARLAVVQHTTVSEMKSLCSLSMRLPIFHIVALFYYKVYNHTN